MYQGIYQDTLQPMIINKEKGVVQDKKVFLYKLYAISSEPSRLTPKLILLKEKVDNLEKTLKKLQSLIKTISFLSPAYYKTI